MEKFKLLFTLVLLTGRIFAQGVFFEDDAVKWATNSVPAIPEEMKSNNSDLLILEERVELLFYAKNNEKLIKNVVLKINTVAGLEKIKNFRLPESIDPAYDEHYFKMGRMSRIPYPFTDEFMVQKFGARKFSNKRWTNISYKLKYEQIRWIKSNGEFMNDQVQNYQLNGLEVGDILEVYYESSFNSNYGNNLFYFNARYPKAKCNYSFVFRINKNHQGYSFVLPVNIPDSCMKNTYTETNEYKICTLEVKLKNLKQVNYPVNSFQGKTLPHVFMDFSFYRVLSNSWPNGSDRIYDFVAVRPKNFEWLIIQDTVNNYTKIYDRHFTTIRKFVSTLPKIGSDSANRLFFKALCDTFNSYRFITSNQLFYNESNLYELASSDHLAKRRLVSHLSWKLYRDILDDNKIFYYDVNVQDKRYGEHNPFQRAHYAYEQKFLAIPYNGSFIYFKPRGNGVKYHLNELPFYQEGTLGALAPRNFQENMKDKDKQFYKFIKTHRGTYNENTRTENATVKISLDSLKANFITKESLSGQYSTVLRHYYLGDYIDSTISPHYFRKCTDKPLSSNVKIRLSSKITDYPFRYTFNCSEKISLTSSKMLSLKDWFSFNISKRSFPEIPASDYYFDFEFSDSYNFLLDFGKDTEITNLQNFSKNISNEFFELESVIVKNSGSTYLVKARVAVKQEKVPVDKVSLLMELVQNLDELNNYSLEIENK